MLLSAFLLHKSLISVTSLSRLVYRPSREPPLRRQDMEQRRGKSRTELPSNTILTQENISRYAGDTRPWSDIISLADVLSAVRHPQVHRRLPDSDFPGFQQLGNNTCSAFQLHHRDRVRVVRLARVSRLPSTPLNSNCFRDLGCATYTEVMPRRWALLLRWLTYERCRYGQARSATPAGFRSASHFPH